jgi:hypothetical protein
MDGLFARWRREIETELEAAQLARNAALLEQDEAERAEAMVRADLAAAEAAFDTLERRVEVEREIEERGAVLLRASGATIAVELRHRLDELRDQARAACRRTTSAGHAVDQTNRRVADLRLAQQQIGLIEPAPSADDADPIAGTA